MLCLTHFKHLHLARLKALQNPIFTATSPNQQTPRKLNVRRVTRTGFCWYILVMNSKFECSLFLGGRLLKSTYKVVIKLTPRNSIFETIKLLMKMSIRRPKCEIVHIFIWRIFEKEVNCLRISLLWYVNNSVHRLARRAVPGQLFINFN